MGVIKSLTSDENTRIDMMAVLVVPYIITCPKVLSTFLFKKKWFDQIFNQIFEKPEEKFSLYAANSLSILSKNLEITYDSFNVQSKIICENSDYLQNDFKGDFITFILRDDAILKFDKCILIEKSQVFERMLCSQFREANENTVVFKNISKNAMLCFLKSLSVCDVCHTSCSNLSQLDMPDLLQIYYLSQLYLLPSLENIYLCQIKETLSDLNVHLALKWSFENYNETLMLFSLSYCLSCDISSTRKLDMLTRIGTLSMKEQIIIYFKEIISKELDRLEISKNKNT